MSGGKVALSEWMVAHLSWANPVTSEASTCWKCAPVALADCTKASVRETPTTKANLREAIFNGTDLTWADPSATRLEGVVFRSTLLDANNFRGDRCDAPAKSHSPLR